MGLDFVGFYLKKNETIEDYKKMSYEDSQARELFYGRKSWELVYALNCSTSGDCISELNLNDWVNLMEKLSYMAPYYDEIREAYAVLNEHMSEYDDWEDFKMDFPREVKLVKAYEKWYNTSFDASYPQLGYDFSVGYMQTFWEAADDVLYYLKNPEYKVFMEASY